MNLHVLKCFAQRYMGKQDAQLETLLSTEDKLLLETMWDGSLEPFPDVEFDKPKSNYEIQSEICSLASFEMKKAYDMGCKPEFRSCCEIACEKYFKTSHVSYNTVSLVMGFYNHCYKRDRRLF